MKSVCPNLLAAWRSAGFSESEIEKIANGESEQVRERKPKKIRKPKKVKPDMPVRRKLMDDAFALLTRGKELGCVLEAITAKGKGIHAMSAMDCWHIVATAYVAREQGVSVKEFHPLSESGLSMLRFAMRFADYKISASRG